MRYKLLNKKEAEEELNKYFRRESNEDYFKELDSEDLSIREYILDHIHLDKSLKPYKFDLECGLILYEYFNMKEDSKTYLDKDEFWIYLSIKVLPDIIEFRHDKRLEYYYEKGSKIYLKSMYKYIDMTYQGSISDTRHALSNLSTDYIINLVDRKSSYLTKEMSRTIIKYISYLPKDIRNQKYGNKILIRRLLSENTKMMTEYCEKDIDINSYILSLFLSVGVDIEKYIKN